MTRYLKNLYCHKCGEDLIPSDNGAKLSCDCTVIVVGSPEYENPEYPIIDQDENPDLEKMDDWDPEMWEDE